MSEFAAGFRIHGLRTALQVRHICSKREKIKTWQNLIPKSQKNEDILQFFVITSFDDHAKGHKGGGGDGRIPCYTGSKETKANASCQRKYPKIS
jgi:hypothetical protein